MPTVGEVVVGLRAETTQFRTGIAQAQATFARLRTDVAQATVAFRRNRIGTEDFAAALRVARVQASELSNTARTRLDADLKRLAVSFGAGSAGAGIIRRELQNVAPVIGQTTTQVAAASTATAAAATNMTRLQRQAFQTGQGLGTLRSAGASLTARLVGLNGTLGTLISGIGQFALGNLISIGIIGGIAAIALGFRKLADRAREAREQASQAAKTFRELLGRGAEAFDTPVTIRQAQVRIEAGETDLARMAARRAARITELTNQLIGREQRRRTPEELLPILEADEELRQLDADMQALRNTLRDLRFTKENLGTAALEEQRKALEKSQEAARRAAEAFQAMRDNLEDAQFERLILDPLRKLQGELAALEAALSTPLDNLLAQVEVVEEAITRGLVDPETGESMIRELTRRFEEAAQIMEKEGAPEVVKAGRNLGREFAQAFGSTIAAEISRLFGGGGIFGRIFGTILNFGLNFALGRLFAPVGIAKAAGEAAGEASDAATTVSNVDPALRVDFTNFPKAPDALSLARDAQWQKYLREGLLVAQSQGFRLA